MWGKHVNVRVVFCVVFFNKHSVFVCFVVVCFIIILIFFFLNLGKGQDRNSITVIHFKKETQYMYYQYGFQFIILICFGTILLQLLLHVQQQKHKILWINCYGRRSVL